MTYEQAIDFLYNRLPRFDRIGAGAYKPGLERTLALAAAFDNPHRQGVKMIHIAGTNGKGSTAHTLAAILSSAGYRTGLFTSPHLVDFRERIRIDGAMIPRDEVTAFVERFKERAGDLEPSFFELTTVMALDWFARQGVDIAVIETGLGGRLDSTNIITPLLSVITNISLDHTSLLGTTPVEIAAEKAGIIKHGVPVVIGEAEGVVRDLFARVAAERGSEITFADVAMPLPGATVGVDGNEYPSTPFGPLHGQLAGECQVLNMATILTAVTILQPFLPKITAGSVADGIGHVTELTGLMGRWTCLSTSPRVIIDTGHNPGGWVHTVPQINNVDATTRHIIIGSAADKDVDAVLNLMREIKDARFYFTAPSTPRALSVDALAARAGARGLHGRCYATVAEAYQAARAAASPDDLIFVGGSNFVVADFLTSLRG
ncbi:MAG: bifunctional folylpolyglutamate synthase/dihydrofolate synthase [Muribaculaceae bacterium]|nr:bifunctional folylpolyglutamate synthase/dihydrofolate synthase [Muribaculaceae bacterium]